MIRQVICLDKVISCDLMQVAFIAVSIFGLLYPLILYYTTITKIILLLFEITITFAYLIDLSIAY